MREALIVSAVRTAIGTSFKGTLRDTEPEEMVVPLLSATLDQAPFPAELVDDFVLAESLHGGGDIARLAAVAAGLPEIPGVALNRHCAGGLASIIMAAAAVRGLDDRVVLAGGVQSSSTAPALRLRTDPDTSWVFRSHPHAPDAPADDMSITVGWNAAQLAGITRREQDDWALRSHRRALTATGAGQFRDEIVPLEVRLGDGPPVEFAVDEHPRATTSEAKLADLAVLHPEISGFSVTAGNASGINDGAAIVSVVRSDVATAHGLVPLAVILGGATVGVAPVETGLAPAPAVMKALERLGMKPADVDLWEINEAFASVAIAASRALGLDEAIVNPFGSGCSLGHPVAATGARMVTTLAHELHRRGGGVGVAAMCAGGGMASAVVIEAR